MFQKAREMVDVFARHENAAEYIYVNFGSIARLQHALSALYKSLKFHL
jgi:hypothetical protein